MREIIKRQMDLGEVDIGAIEISAKSRDDIPRLLRGLQHIYTTRALREAVFEILVEVVPRRPDDGEVVSVETGRPGMSQWQILVLGVLRLGLNADYDRIAELANEHKTLRQMLGHADWTDDTRWHVQTLKDNLRLFTPEVHERINRVVVDAGHSLVKKARAKGLKRTVTPSGFFQTFNQWVTGSSPVRGANRIKGSRGSVTPFLCKRCSSKESSPMRRRLSRMAERGFCCAAHGVCVAVESVPSWAAVEAEWRLLDEDQFVVARHQQGITGVTVLDDDATLALHELIAGESARGWLRCPGADACDGLRGLLHGLSPVGALRWLCSSAALPCWGFRAALPFVASAVRRSGAGGRMRRGAASAPDLAQSGLVGAPFQQRRLRCCEE
jgi:hypothetical protein